MSQVIDRVRQANPVPDSSRPLPDPVEFRRMVLEKGAMSEPVLHDRIRRSRRGGMLAAVSLALAIATAVGTVAVWFGARDADLASLGSEPDAVATGKAYFAALDAGDAVSAMALLRPEVLESSFVAPAHEFLAALPASLSLHDCAVVRSADEITVVSCTLMFDGPLFAATGDRLDGSRFTVDEGGLLRDLPNLGLRSRGTVNLAFSEYAARAEPEAFAKVCAPDAYPVGSVQVQGGHAWTGPCGELWARLAEEAAAWVRAGKPPLD